MMATHTNENQVYMYDVTDGQRRHLLIPCSGILDNDNTNTNTNANANLPLKIAVTLILSVGWVYLAIICLLSAFWEYDPQKLFDYYRLIPGSAILVGAILFSWMIEWIWKIRRRNLPEGSCFAAAATTTAATTTASRRRNEDDTQFHCRAPYMLYAVLIGGSSASAIVYMLLLGYSKDTNYKANEVPILLPILVGVLISLLLVGASFYVEQQQQQQQHQQESDNIRQEPPPQQWVLGGLALLRLLGCAVLGGLLFYFTYLGIHASEVFDTVVLVFLPWAVACGVFPIWGHLTRHAMSASKPFIVARTLVTVSILGIWTWYAWLLLMWVLEIWEDDSNSRLDIFQVIAISMLLIGAVLVTSCIEWLWEEVEQGRPLLLERWYNCAQEERPCNDDHGGYQYQKVCLAFAAALGWGILSFNVAGFFFPEECEEGERSNCGTNNFFALQLGIMNLTVLLTVIGIWGDPREKEGDMDDAANCISSTTLRQVLCMMLGLMIVFGFLLYDAACFFSVNYETGPSTRSSSSSSLLLASNPIMSTLWSMALLVWGYFFRRVVGPKGCVCNGQTRTATTTYQATTFSLLESL